MKTENSAASSFKSDKEAVLFSDKHSADPDLCFSNRKTIRVPADCGFGGFGRIWHYNAFESNARRLFVEYLYNRGGKMSKFDSGFVSILNFEESVPALVRVRNAMHLSALEKRFNVTNIYPFIRSVGITCSLEDAIRLERMQEVEYVSVEGRVAALDNSATISGTENSENHGAENIRSLNDVFQLSSSLTGEGVTLCVMDTGIAVHSDLSIPRDRIVHFVDLIGNKDEPYDDNGHGTFISGIAAGNGLLSGGKIKGVAPESNLLGIKVIGKTGETGTFKILDGMQWLFDNFRQYNIKVVCMSFGAEPLTYADPLKLGAEMLVRSGITVVCAAGNSGPNALKSPAISPEVIAVGSVGDDDKPSSFSSYGLYQGVYRPDVYARGEKVAGIEACGTYSFMTGTSVSAPYIAGACCLLYEKYRNIQPRQVKNAILQSTRQAGGHRIFEL